MTWMMWRQYRYQGALAAVLLAALAIVLVITGLHAAQVWHCLQARDCSGVPLSSPGPEVLVIATIAVPVLPGLFWGAPMVAHEVETGTNQLAWTQSITRRRWLAIRAGWLLLAAAVLAGTVSALVTWWLGPFRAKDADAFLAGPFDITYIVPAAYAVFAMALGICVGLLLRRTIPALAVTLASFFGVRALFSYWLRMHYLTPVTAYSKLTANSTPPGDFLSVGYGISAPAGRLPALSSDNYINNLAVPVRCVSAADQDSCMSALGYRHYWTYQPGSRFWAFQGIETGIFVALAAILLGVTFWTISRRDA
jgi:hypothetical protein